MIYTHVSVNLNIYYNLLKREMKRERELVSLSGEGREFQ